MTSKKEKRKNMDALFMIVACVVLILAIPGESQSFVSNNVTIQFNKTCSSNVSTAERERERERERQRERFYHKSSDLQLR